MRYFSTSWPGRHGRGTVRSASLASIRSDSTPESCQKNIGMQGIVIIQKKDNVVDDRLAELIGYVHNNVTMIRNQTPSFLQYIIDSFSATSLYSNNNYILASINC